MALEYFPCYNSYEEKTAKLTDEELGRLFRALMHYSNTGEITELDGREELAFDFMVPDIDRAKEQYEKKCNRNSENGTKGGRPTKANGLEENPTVLEKANGLEENPTVLEKANGLEENPTVILETEKSQTKTKTKSKTNINTYIPPVSPQGEPVPEQVKPIFDDWIKFKREQKFVYKPESLRALANRMTKSVDEYGLDAVKELVNTSISNGYKGIIWDRLRKPTKPPNKALACSSRKYSADEVNGMGVELLD